MKNLLAPLLVITCSATLAAQTNVCITAVDGTGCGPQLDVSFTPFGASGNQTITVDTSGLHVGGIGLMAWGNQAINVPIFGVCNAYTDFIWGHPVNPDATGSWSWSRSWPNTVQGSYRIQVASLGFDTGGNLEITTTDCIVASCSL